jgi:phage tail tape-measure protein
MDNANNPVEVETAEQKVGETAGLGAGILVGARVGTMLIPVPIVGTFLGGLIGGALGSELGKRIVPAVFEGATTFYNSLMESGPAERKGPTRIEVEGGDEGQ